MALHHRGSQAVYPTQPPGWLPAPGRGITTHPSRAIGAAGLSPAEWSALSAALLCLCCHPDRRVAAQPGKRSSQQRLVDQVGERMKPGRRLPFLARRPLPCEVPLTCPATSKRRSCSPPQSSHPHGPPLLARVRVPIRSPRSSLLFGPPTPRAASSRKFGFPSLEPTCIRLPLLQGIQGLPDDWPILLSTRRGRTPRRLRYPLDRHASSATAFQHNDALGTGIMEITRLHSHGSHSRVPTHQRDSYLPRCKARYRPAGLRFDRTGFAPAGWVIQISERI